MERPILRHSVRCLLYVGVLGSFADTGVAWCDSPGGPGGASGLATIQHRSELLAAAPAEFNGEYPTRRPPSDFRRWRQAYELSVLGDAYWHGRGLEADPEKAVALYRRAASAGSVLGMSGLARAHYLGRGAERNIDVAVHWLEQTARKRMSAAFFELALHYRRGTTGAANPAKAHLYLAQGLDIAMWSASRSRIERKRSNPAGAAYMGAGDVFACTEAAPRDYSLAIAFWARASIEGYGGLWWRLRNLVTHVVSRESYCGRR
ncbi:MAG: hypothetical protein U1F37_16905 [Alphaproteobacteria bacterium]